MTDTLQAIVGADILTPEGVVQSHALLHRAGIIQAVQPDSELAKDASVVQVEGGLLAPGLVDLQVNGGGGLMFNNAPEIATLRHMAETHARIGSTSILPTLITDTAAITKRAVSAVAAAIKEGVLGIVGLHLEGPHLSMVRKGAHDPDLIRPMEQADLELLLETAARLPVLKVTVAPESVSDTQIRSMADSGILVSLGHTSASYDECRAAADSGARCVTHLFNAQSQMRSREPGTVGATLALGELSAGLIADAIHVHPASMRNAIHAKAGPGHVFLVSDAMATVGSDIAGFRLNGREIHRNGNRLALADGTLAGAHIELLDAVQNVSRLAGVSFETALEMASRIPADLIRQNRLGRLSAGARADILHIGSAGTLQQVWQNGSPVVL